MQLNERDAVTRESANRLDFVATNQRRNLARAGFWLGLDDGISWKQEQLTKRIRPLGIQWVDERIVHSAARVSCVRRVSCGTDTDRQTHSQTVRQTAASQTARQRQRQTE